MIEKRFLRAKQAASFATNDGAAFARGSDLAEHRRRQLARFLCVLGAVDFASVAAVLMPSAWMAEAHRLLELGELPDAPVVGYLARSASALYALHGAMLVFLSWDVARYRPLIAFLAWAALVHGAVLLVIDWAEGLPLWWTLAEGPVYLALAAAVLILLWRERAACDESCSMTDEPVKFAAFTRLGKPR